jgi:addiction module RelE/StbE family toxin
MKYRIKYLKISKDDLKEIRDYLNQFYKNTTRNFLTDLRKQVNLLEDIPFIYEKYPDDPYFRKMVVGDYLVFYHVDEEKQIIEIHRILHGSKNIRQYI